MQHHSNHTKEFKTRLWISLIITVPILLLSETIQTWLGLTWLQVPLQNEILLVLSAVIFVYGGWPFLKGMAQELKSRQPGMMTLIGTAISVAFFYSAATVLVLPGMDFFWELATLIDVMLFGHWIEMKSVLGASRALEELVRVMPTNARVLRDGGIFEVSVAELKAGDVVLVRPGEKIPSDGTVVEGESAVNEALLTGESAPVQKLPKSAVIGGAINGEGSLKVRIEKTGEATYLAQVVNLVKQAQQSKSRTQDLANRAAALLFYTAISVGLVTFLVWAYFVGTGIALERSVTVLVIACPHALGLAIPLVVALSTSITARSGILIRNRKAYEMVKDIDVVVFDKTGTLTEGKFGINTVIAYVPEGELLTKTASVEQYSEHIIAKAIVNYAKEQGVTAQSASDFKALPGKGAYGKVDGVEIYVGSPGLLKDLQVEASDERVADLEGQGSTLIFTVIGGKLAGVFALSDKIRGESKEAAEKLMALGVKVYMLTGDSNQVAQSVAKNLGITDYFAQVLPDQKAERISMLQAKGYRVAMVGDGINDAPALVTADVGVAIGAGTDVAIESADIILVKNDPRAVLRVVELSKRTYSKMVQNLWWAAGYNIVAIPLAAGVLYGYGVLLPPAVGALLMSLSTVIVAVNSQTLRKYDTAPVNAVATSEDHAMHNMKMDHSGHSM
jgi:Cu2+-exporting ATPase